MALSRQNSPCFILKARRASSGETNLTNARLSTTGGVLKLSFLRFISFCLHISIRPLYHDLRKSKVELYTVAEQLWANIVLRRKKTIYTYTLLNKALKWPSIDIHQLLKRICPRRMNTEFLSRSEPFGQVSGRFWWLYPDSYTVLRIRLSTKPSNNFPIGAMIVGVDWEAHVLHGLLVLCYFLRKPWNIIHCMPCRTPCSLFIHSSLIRLLGPQALVQSEIGCLSIFHQWENLKFNIQRLSNSSVKCQV